MRLRRTGAKKQPRYRVVIAEARTPRDGAFVDSIGFYDPLTDPATIRIDRDKALDWIRKGAQPSDTVVRLLRRSGITEGVPEQRIVSPNRPAPAAPAAEPRAATAAPAAATPAMVAAEAPAAEPAPAPAAESEPETATEATDGNGSDDK